MTDWNSLKLDALWMRLAADGLATRLLELARDEDLGPKPGVGDLTSAVMVEEHATATAELVFRSAGVVSGLFTLPQLLGVFEFPGEAGFRLQDGARARPGASVAQFRGPARGLLAMERTVLNLIGRLSGIATRTAEFVEAVEGTRARVFDTRKTTPGLRVFEKYAVRCGGGMCHRMGLHDAVLIKDNHLTRLSPAKVAAAVEKAAHQARLIARFRGVELGFVECEVDRLEQLGAILDAGGCGAGIMLLDNMSLEQMREAVAMRDRSGLKIELEASGGVTLQTIRAIAETGVERISVGALTHQAVSVDVALDFQ